MAAGIVLGKLLPGAISEPAQHRIRPGQPDQRANRRPDLADDHADDDEGRFLVRQERRAATQPVCSSRCFVNWVVKPFSMALLAWVFFRIVFAAFITPAEADQYIAGCIILAAAPCTAMVFVWSHLTNGDPAYTLVQVSVNDLIMLVLFVPIVQFLVHGASSLTVPFNVLLTSVVVFIVVPLVAGVLLRTLLLRARAGMVRRCCCLNSRR